MLERFGPKTCLVDGMEWIALPYAKSRPGKVDASRRQETRPSLAKFVREATELQQVTNQIAKNGMIKLTGPTGTGMASAQKEIDKVVRCDPMKAKAQLFANTTFDHSESVRGEGMVRNIDKIFDGRRRAIFKLGGNPSTSTVQ